MARLISVKLFYEHKAVGTVPDIILDAKHGAWEASGTIGHDAAGTRTN